MTLETLRRRDNKRSREKPATGVVDGRTNQLATERAPEYFSTAFPAPDKRVRGLLHSSRKSVERLNCPDNHAEKDRDATAARPLKKSSVNKHTTGANREVKRRGISRERLGGN